MIFERYKSQNKIYYRIIECIKVERNGVIKTQKKQIKSLGNATNYPYTYEELREAFKNGIAIIPEFEDLIDENGKQVKLAPKTPEIETKNVGYLLIENVFNELGLSQLLTLKKSRKNIKYDVLGLTKQLVIDRFLNPDSKIKTFECRHKYKYLSPLTTSTDWHDIYKVLDVLSDKKTSIINSMNKNIEEKVGRNHDFVYYDVTNYYFEIDKNDELQVDPKTGETLDLPFRRTGVSKEKRKDPIVQMGMFLDSNSIPISYKLFRGNMLDKQTLVPILKQEKEMFKDKKVLIVGDRGMVNGANELPIINSDNDYLFAKGIRQTDKTIKAWALEQEGYTHLSNDFKYKSKIIERSVLDKKTGKKTKIKEKILIFWSRKYFNKEKREKDSFIETLHKYIDDPASIPSSAKKGLNKYVITLQVDKKTGEILKTKEVKSIDLDKIENEINQLGYYLLTTSDLEMDEKDMISTYKGLTKIENCFKITKSQLKARPVFVSTSKHLEAHFLICFIALTIIRLIQQKVVKYENKEVRNVWEEGISARKLKEILLSFNTYNSIYGCSYQEKSNVNHKELERLLEALDIKMLEFEQRESDVKRTLKFAL